jgi:hypothetical protein
MERVDILGGFLQVLPEIRIQIPECRVPELPRDLQGLEVHAIEFQGHLPKGLVTLPPHPFQKETDAMGQLGLVGGPAVQEA